MVTIGPDGCGYYGGSNWGLSHERLAIMDPDGGHQPIVYDEKKTKASAIASVVNGEIYNHHTLIEKYKVDGDVLLSSSDSECVNFLY